MIAPFDRGDSMTSATPFNEYLLNLKHVQTRLLSMPEEHALSETFAFEQDKLAELIANLSQYTAEEQESAKILMHDFAEKLNAKLEQLKLRMGQLSEGIDQQQNRMRGMRAYGQGKIF